MNTALLDVLPVWSLLLIASALLWLGMESGYRLGRWRHAHRPDEHEQPVGAMVASILGLLALVLGFTFSLAASRFDGRRMAVLDEANAIGTTYLRARLLPEPYRSEIVALLREYVEQRIQGANAERVESAIRRSEELQERLWQQTAGVSEQDSHSIITGLYIQSLNEVIDMHATRVMAGIYSRVPLVLWGALLGLAMVGMTAVGYQSGLSTTRRSPAMLGLILAFSMVLYLIADLDRGQEGLLRVSLQALVDVQRSMNVAASP